jgi:uncharacterized protein (TIGR02466 family)
MSFQYIDIFPTRIWQARLSELADDIPSWAAAALAMRGSSPVSAKRSLREGWTSDDLGATEQDVFGRLHERILELSRLALVDVGMKDPEIQLQSWINIQDRGGFNFLHMHCGALLTGCFYLQVPEGAGSLVFRDPRPGVLNTYITGVRPNALADIGLRPETGLLRLFPPWLEHFVEPNESSLPRIALGFNVVRH